VEIESPFTATRPDCELGRGGGVAVNWAVFGNVKVSPASDTLSETLFRK
jgi:hypothetical protein